MCVACAFTRYWNNNSAAVSSTSLLLFITLQQPDESDDVQRDDGWVNTSERWIEWKTFWATSALVLQHSINIRHHTTFCVWDIILFNLFKIIFMRVCRSILHVWFSFIRQYHLKSQHVLSLVIYNAQYSVYYMISRLSSNNNTTDANMQQLSISYYTAYNINTRTISQQKLEYIVTIHVSVFVSSTRFSYAYIIYSPLLLIWNAGSSEE